MSEMQAGKRVNLLLLCLCAPLYVAAPTNSVCGNEARLQWQPPANVRTTAFELGAGKGEFHAWGRGRDLRFFFGEFLPALFERTIVLDEFGADSELHWIFTGEQGGFTVTIDQNEVSLSQRFYDSFAFNQINNDITRHPEWRAPPIKAAYRKPLRAVTIMINHKLDLSVALNGRPVLREDCLFDVSRHQLRLAGGEGKVRGTMLHPNPESAVVRIDPAKRRQTMMGFGGIATPTADDLLVSAFAGDSDIGTVVILNRSTKPRQVLVHWPNVTFTEMELVDPYYENDVRKAPAIRADGTTEIIVEPGALITLTNVPLGQ